MCYQWEVRYKKDEGVHGLPAAREAVCPLFMNPGHQAWNCGTAEKAATCGSPHDSQDHGSMG